MEKYLRFRRPSRTLYTKSWNARSTGGRFGRCVSVFGCDGTICNLTAPLFLSSIKFSLTQSPSTIFTVFKFLSTEFLKFDGFIALLLIRFHTGLLSVFWMEFALKSSIKTTVRFWLLNILFAIAHTSDYKAHWNSIYFGRFTISFPIWKENEFPCWN